MPAAYRFLSEWKIERKINKDLSPLANQLAFAQDFSNYMKKCYGCGLPNHTIITCPNCKNKKKPYKNKPQKPANKLQSDSKKKEK